MNRSSAAILASLLAAAGTACGPTSAPPPPYTDVTFYWQFQDWDGNVYGDFSSAFPGCGVANVDEVRVSLFGPAGPLPPVTVPCVAVNGMPGATFTAVPTGPYSWLIEGLRIGFPVFSVEGGGDVVDFPFFDARLDAVYPNMNLYYDLPPGVNCTGISEILFELDNLDARLIEYSSANAFVTCLPPPSNGFAMPSIPVGNLYAFRYIAAVDSFGQSLYQTCDWPPGPALVQGPTGSTYTAPLDPSVGTCP